MKYNENILSKTRQALFKSGVHYASTNETLYKTLKIGYIIFFIWVALINTTHVLSVWLKISNNGDKYIIDDIQLTQLKNSIPFVIIATLLLVLAYVFAVTSKHMASLILGAVIPVVLFFHFRNLYADNILENGIKSSFYTRHAIPLILIFILAIWMGIIGIREKSIEKKAYIKFTEGLYARFKENQTHLSEQQESSEAFNLSSKEWNDYMDEFAGFEHKKPKRSIKQKIKKQVEQDNI